MFHGYVEEKLRGSTLFANMNSQVLRIKEPHEYRSPKKLSYFFKNFFKLQIPKFDIVGRTPHPTGGSPVSIFKIQNRRGKSGSFRTVSVAL